MNERKKFFGLIPAKKSKTPNNLEPPRESTPYEVLAESFPTIQTGDILLGISTLLIQPTTVQLSQIEAILQEDAQSNVTTSIRDVLTRAKLITPYNERKLNSNVFANHVGLSLHGSESQSAKNLLIDKNRSPELIEALRGTQLGPQIQSDIAELARNKLIDLMPYDGMLYVAATSNGVNKAKRSFDEFDRIDMGGLDPLLVIGPNTREIRPRITPQQPQQ